MASTHPGPTFRHGTAERGPVWPAPRPAATVGRAAAVAAPPLPAARHTASAPAISSTRLRRQPGFLATANLRSASRNTGPQAIAALPRQLSQTGPNTCLSGKGGCGRCPPLGLEQATVPAAPYVWAG